MIFCCLWLLLFLLFVCCYFLTFLLDGWASFSSAYNFSHGFLAFSFFSSHASVVFFYFLLIYRKMAATSPLECTGDHTSMLVIVPAPWTLPKIVLHTLYLLSSSSTVNLFCSTALHSLQMQLSVKIWFHHINYFSNEIYLFVASLGAICNFAPLPQGRFEEVMFRFVYYLV